MVIYKITNKINGKVYVGQTVQSPGRRWALHKHQYSVRLDRPLYRSMHKHGFGNFVMEVLETLPNDAPLEVLNAREQFWVAELKSMVPTGYNLTNGGHGKHYVAEETKARISASKIGKPRSPETIEKMRLGAMGNTSKRGSKLSAESRARISQVQLGRKISEETKAKMVAAHLSRKIYNAKPVQCIETGEVFKSTGDAARALGLQQTSISAICRGIRKSTGGRTFKFL